MVERILRRSGFELNRQESVRKAALRRQKSGSERKSLGFSSMAGEAPSPGGPQTEG
jgi:hypothetical protein